MSNSTMPSWEEWSKQLTKEQRDYSLYKILSALHARLDNIPEQFASKKDVKWLIWGFRVIVASIVGAFLYVLRTL